VTVRFDNSSIRKTQIYGKHTNHGLSYVVSNIIEWSTHSKNK
jgi:hypothetical protein